MSNPMEQSPLPKEPRSPPYPSPIKSAHRLCYIMDTGHGTVLNSPSPFPPKDEMLEESVHILNVDLSELGIMDTGNEEGDITPDSEECIPQQEASTNIKESTSISSDEHNSVMLVMANEGMTCLGNSEEDKALKPSTPVKIEDITPVSPVSPVTPTMSSTANTYMSSPFHSEEAKAITSIAPLVPMPTTLVKLEQITPISQVSSATLATPVKAKENRPITQFNNIIPTTPVKTITKEDKIVSPALPVTPVSPVTPVKHKYKFGTTIKTLFSKLKPGRGTTPVSPINNGGTVHDNSFTPAVYNLPEHENTLVDLAAAPPSVSPPAGKLRKKASHGNVVGRVQAFPVAQGMYNLPEHEKSSVGLATISGSNQASELRKKASCGALVDGQGGGRYPDGEERGGVLVAKNKEGNGVVGE